MKKDVKRLYIHILKNKESVEHQYFILRQRGIIGIEFKFGVLMLLEP